MFAKCARIALLGKVRQTTGINHGPYSYAKQSQRTLLQSSAHTKSGKTFVLFSFHIPEIFITNKLNRSIEKGDSTRWQERERERKAAEEKNELKHVHLSCENEQRKVLRLQNTNERTKTKQAIDAETAMWQWRANAKARRKTAIHGFSHTKLCSYDVIG